MDYTSNNSYKVRHGSNWPVRTIKSIFQYSSWYFCQYMNETQMQFLEPTDEHQISGGIFTFYCWLLSPPRQMSRQLNRLKVIQFKLHFALQFAARAVRSPQDDISVNEKTDDWAALIPMEKYRYVQGGCSDNEACGIHSKCLVDMCSSEHNICIPSP